jgi:hypothetical protein
MDAAAMIATIQHAAFGAMAGVMIGFAHLHTLSPSVRWMTKGRVGAAAGLQALRFVLLALVLVLLARLGAVDLISAAVALVAVRALMIRRQARKSGGL